jgi:serine/threonine protein phosphatase 1
MSDLTDGQRIYAIGDIHGCRDLLDGVLARVDADLAARPHRRPRLVLLGDYVDRGPDSRGVIEALLALEAGPVAVDFLLGNHDAMALGFLAEPEDQPRSVHWLHPNLGGDATLRSYGVEGVLDDGDLRRGHADFVEAFPAAHRAFLERCVLRLAIGGYFFAHAGVRPGVPLDAQDAEDLIWIREPFLSSTADHGAKVVHGHTIVPFVEHHRNRIAADTGAVRSGTLSCVVLEGPAVGLLGAEGVRPLPVGAGLGLDRLGLRLGERLRHLKW